MDKFPHYHQLDYSDCGPTCLRMIAKYYGNEYSLEMLRRHSYISREGVSMLGISDAAEYIGFKTIGVTISLEQLANDAPLPCILHWNHRHFVVCYGIKKNKNGGYNINIADPASQKICYNDKEIKKCWLNVMHDGQYYGNALLLEPTPEFGKKDEELQIEKKSLSFYFRYFLPYRNLFGQLLLALMVSSALQLVLPFLTQLMVDKGINARNMSVITLVLIIQLGFFISQLFIDYIRGWILLYVNSRIDISLISDFLRKLTSMPLFFYETKNTGDIIQRIGDYGRIKGFLMGNSMSMLFSIVNFFIFSVVLFFYHGLIFLIFMTGYSLYIIWIFMFMRYRRELDIKRFNQSALEQNRIIQLIQGMQDIKLNNCEKQKRWEWEHIQVQLFKIGVKGLRIGQIQEAGSILFTKTTDIIISFIAAYAIVNGEMTLGMMMSLTYILGQVSAPIRSAIGFAQSLQDAKISLERLNEINSQEDEETHIDVKMNELPVKRDIRIEGLKFSYSGANSNYALEDITVDIPAHKVTAIVGESGCGKTTLIKLLQGFYIPNSGKITIGGVRLDSINPHLWRSVTGSVMQEGFIFSDTIAKNISLSTDEVDTKRLLRACMMARADGFISAMPMGYETKIGMEGNGISQGQKQRLLIARAIYKNPDYIFFDEATNFLDATNESAIMHNLHEFYKSKTVVIAAHRLCTIKDADQIIVMKEGHIVEIGEHEDLISRKGEYYTLVRKQMSLIE